MAAAMTGNVSGNAGFSRTFFEKLIDTGFIQISPCPGAWKKNVSWLAALEPVLCQKIKVSVRKDGISITPALAFTDMNGLVGTGYIFIMKMDNFRHP